MRSKSLILDTVQTAFYAQLAKYFTDLQLTLKIEYYGLVTLKLTITKVAKYKPTNNYVLSATEIENEDWNQVKWLIESKSIK